MTWTFQPLDRYFPADKLSSKPRIGARTVYTLCIRPAEDVQERLLYWRLMASVKAMNPTFRTPAYRVQQAA